MNKRLFAETLNLSAALTMILMYFYMLDLFQPYYLILHRGVAWLRIYDIGLTDGNLLDVLPLIVASIILIAYYATNRFNGVSLIRLSTYSIATLTVINLLPLFYWITYMYNPTGQTLTAYGPLPYLDTGLFHVYAPVYPPLLLAMLYAWLPTITIKTLGKRIRLRVKYFKPLNTSIDASQSSGTSMERLGIVSIILLSIALPLIPYLPTINPDFKPVSVDIKYYSTWLNNMLTGDVWNAVEYAFRGMRNGNRPLYLLLIYGLIKLGIPKELVLNLEALFIAPFFALAVYFSAKRTSGNAQYAILASLSGVLGFNMTVGMITGFYAAWTALIPFYICIALTSNLEGGKYALICSTFASTVLLHVHPWTWGLLMAVLTVHLAASTLESFKNRRVSINRRLLAVLTLNVLVDVFKTLTTPNYGGLESSISLLSINGVFGLKPLLELPRSLNRLTASYMAGLFFNPIYMLLALIGVLSFAEKKSSISRLILTWVAVSSIMFPFSDINLQSHLLFAMPFPILIAEGLWALSKLLGMFDSKLPKLLKVFFIASSLTYTIRALCNLI